MVSRKTLERYIQQLDEVISSGNTAVAKKLQNEIIAVLSADLDGLKKGLTNYSAVGAFSDSRTGKTIVVGDELDFIKDAKMLKSRLLMELDKMDEKDMSSILHASPQEKLTLCKKGGSTVSVIAQVDGDKRYSSDAHVIIEEGDVFERHLPNGAKEYYRATDRGFYKGNHGIPDNYQSKVEIVSEGIAVHKMTEEQDEKPHKLFISHSSKDREYMAALVDMLERIGMPGGSFVCTSVPGHGIPEGASIFDWLRKQFLECDLRVVFALSHNYYSSAASLNEMGAAWVTKATDTLLLLPGFEFDEIKDYIQQISERKPFVSYPIHIGHSFYPIIDPTVHNSVQIFAEQHRLLEELSKKSDCIIVGRCADYILRKQSPFRLFVYADMESKIKRCMERQTKEEDFTEREMKRRIEGIDRERAKYYNYFSSQKWGARDNYDLMISTSGKNIKQVSVALAQYLKALLF